MNAMIYAGLPQKVQHFSRNHIKLSDPQQIISAVCDALNVTEICLVGLTRLRTVVEARYIAIGIILEANPKITLKEVGKIFNRDHSTIIYARESFSDLFEISKSFRQKVLSVKKLTHIV